MTATTFWIFKLSTVEACTSETFVATRIKFDFGNNAANDDGTDWVYSDTTRTISTGSVGFIFVAAVY